MKPEKPINEPVFPNTTDTSRMLTDGMTLRDYFAAAAMQAYESQETENRTFEEAATLAYDMAEAMLAERQTREVN